MLILTDQMEESELQLTSQYIGFKFKYNIFLNPNMIPSNNQLIIKHNKEKSYNS